jgi:hypothetical protein
MIKSRMMRRVGIWYAWEICEMLYISVGKPEGKRPLGRPRHKWEEDIRRDLRETVWENVDWIHLAQDRDQ